MATRRSSLLRRILKNKLKKNRTTQSFIWKKKILQDFALGIDFEETDDEETRVLERKAEIEKLHKRREERAVHKAQCEEEAEACAWARAQRDLPEPEREEEEEDRSMLIAVVKEQQRRIQEAMGIRTREEEDAEEVKLLESQSHDEYRAKKPKYTNWICVEQIQ